ncbi:MAG: hypothetical protein ACI93T_000319 [Porticoccaceae bacterium]
MCHWLRPVPSEIDTEKKSVLAETVAFILANVDDRSSTACWLGAVHHADKVDKKLIEKPVPSAERLPD